MTEKGEDTPRDMTPLREGYTLINEGDIEHFLEGDPTLFETLLEVRKVGGSYFLSAPFSLGVETFWDDGSKQLVVMIHVPDMDPDEATLRLERFDMEWYLEHLTERVLVTLSWCTPEETLQEKEGNMYAYTT